ncbi:hypothetical protein GQ600_20467 [Phytophthora cactorum]|nr:hypothetical protein GQ600_20467 [Phytophthora cactorum]
MSRLMQIAQRSNKAPHNTELVAVIMGRKKKIPTKTAPYQPADPGDDGSLRRLNGSRAIQASHSRSGDTGEVVWGDMVAFSSTLYMAKSGLFQAKRFQVHVNAAGENGRTVAIFEFDLAELVPLSKDSGKESVRLNATKCSDDPRACISLTVVSSRVHRDSEGHDKERSYVDDSASEIGSEMSAYTNHSRASSLASNCRRNIDVPIPEHLGGLGDGKADVIRIAGHPAASEEAIAATDNARDELVRALQNLEVQLRETRTCQTAVKETVVARSGTGMYTITDVENEEEVSKEEANETKKDVKDDPLRLLLPTSTWTLRNRTWSLSYDQAKDEELQQSTAALQRAESVRNEVSDDTAEAEIHAQVALETALSDNKRLEKQLLKFDGAMTAMEEEKARLMVQLREAEMASAAAQEEIVKVQNALEQLESKSQKLSAKLQEADQARELAEENVVAAEATIGTLQQQVRDVSTQLHETQYELETLREKQLTASSAALEEATAKHQALERLWEDVKTENERLQARVEELEFRLAQSEANGEEKTAELQAQVVKVKREADALREELDSLRASKTQIENESLEREQKLHEATETHRRISVDHDERLSSEVMAREELLTRLQEQVQQTEKMSAELSGKVVTLQQELDYFQGELIENKMKVAQLTQDNDDLSIRNRRLEKELAANTKNEPHTKSVPNFLAESTAHAACSRRGKGGAHSAPARMDLFARARSVIDHRGASAVTRRHSREQDAQDTQDSREQDQDRVLGGPQAKVRALLDEMLASASWGEKEHEGEERRLLNELQNCVLDAESHQALEQLPKRMCAYEFKPGDIAWNCKVCQVDETLGTRRVLYTTQGSTRCRSIELPASDLLANSRECIGEVMKLVLDSVKEARFGSVINEDDLEVMRDKLGSEAPDRRYSVIVHYNELQTSQEFATALNKAHPAIAYQMLKIVGETSYRSRAHIQRAILQPSNLCEKAGCRVRSLEVLVNSVLETLRKKARTDFIDIAFEDTWNSMIHVLHPDHNRELDVWDVFAMGIQRSQGSTLRDVNVSALVLEAERAGYRIRHQREMSPFLSLPPETELTGRFELDVTSPVFVYRRYMSGLLDLRYVLQIEGISESFVLEKGGSRLARFLLYLAYIQSACSEARRFGDHVEMESRGWVVTVEFVSTTSDVSSRVLVDEESVWVHDADSSIGFWHRVHLIEPVLQAIVWDAQVHSGLWVRNGMSVINHSMNYGEPPFCARFRDLDLLLLQFSFQLLGVDWVMASIMERFDVEEWYEAAQSADAKEAELMVTECLALLSQLASELPPKVTEGDAMRSLIPYLRREIVQRLFSGGPVLDQILKEVCVEAGFSTSSGSGDSSAPGGGKFQYRLKPELYAEYNPTFVHLTRKQHESAHENWFQHRLRSSKKREQEQADGSPNNTHSTWLDYPMVNMFLPCPLGFRLSRISILHENVRRLVYESLWRATTDAHSSLSVLSRAVHLFTLQLYVVEDVRYFQTMVPASDAENFERERASRIADSFIEWIPLEQPSLFSDAEPRCAILHLLLKLNPWSSHGGSASMTKLDGDQKHEIGRGIDWLLHRLSRISPECRSVVEQHQVTEQESRDEAARKLALAQRRKEAQMRAMRQMQQRQAAFAEQMKVMANETDAVGEEELVECAMCHSVNSENSFMCYVGFAQCSPVLSRLNGGSHGQYLSTPMDEMHVGEDIPVHVRLCGHSVHHKCWESYHTSQFQRAITGGHHRHALNAVDVTKKEFLCPLCKSISNVLIPTTTDEESKFLPAMKRRASVDGSGERDMATATQLEMVHWLEHAVGRDARHDTADMNGSTDSSEDASAMLLEQKPASISSNDEDPGETQLNKWLEDGLASLCMAIHKVACGAMQKSQPERYTTSGCNALFHTLLCSFLDTHDTDQLREHLFLEAMRFLPLMLKHVNTRLPPNVSVAPTDLYARILHLLFYGGSDILRDGTVVLERSTVGEEREDAVFIARLVVLARLVQTLLWYAITRKEEFTNAMADDLAFSEENVAFFTACLSDESGETNREDAVGHQLEVLLETLMTKCDGAFEVESIADMRQLLNVVACEVVPLAKVATFMIQSLTRRARTGTTAASKPIFITQEDVVAVGFVRLSALQLDGQAMAHDRQRGPHSEAGATVCVRRDLHTMHSTISVFSSGSNRTRYLRSLPRPYVKFYSELAKRRCQSCHQFPARPAVCLLCGMLLCAANTCPSIHLDKGGYPDEANPAGSVRGSLYVDEYGEEFGERNRELSKGRPLYLNEERRERLLRLWLRHEIPNEVVKIQNSSERVIRNSHY